MSSFYTVSPTSLSLLIALLSGLELSAAPREPEALSPLQVNTTRARGTRKSREGHHRELTELVEESGLTVRRLGGMGSASVVSARGGGAHQLGMNLEGVPLQGSLSQGFDLSLFPSFTLRGVELTEGVMSGESGAQTAELTLRLPRLEHGRQQRAQLAASTTRGAELGLWLGGAGPKGGAGAWVSYGGGSGAFPYRDRYGLLKRREGAAYQRGSLGLMGSTNLGGLPVSAFLALSGIERGEPGPEGQEELGGESVQQSVALSLKLERGPRGEPWAWLRPEAQLYVSERGYLYEEERPLWQSASEARFVSESHDSGLKLTWAKLTQVSPPPSSGVGLLFWGGGLSAQARQEVVELLEGAAEGGRFERARFALTPSLKLGLRLPTLGTLTLQSAARLDMNTEREGLWVPSAGLKLQPTGWVSCELRASEAFRDPSFDERHLRGPGLIPNPSLSHEDGWWVDVGCGLQYRGERLRARLSALAFKQDYERLILYIPLDPYRIQASDAEGAAIYGVTLKGQASYRPRPPWPVLRLEARSTLQEHALTSAPYTPLPLRPLYFAWARLELGFRPSALWLKLTERGPLYADRYGLRTLEGFRVIDLGVARTWALSPDHYVKVNASVRNALDEVMRDAVLRPLPGRSVWLSLSFEAR